MVKKTKSWTDLQQYGNSIQWIHDEIMTKLKASKSKRTLNMEELIQVAGRVSHMAIAVRKLTNEMESTKRIDKLEALINQIPIEVMAKYVTKERLEGIKYDV